jgi:hypothetical protein
MNRAVPAHALFVCALAATGFAASPAHAQFLSTELDRTQFDQRLRQPALRLATLGRLTLALDDENNEINQWDFGNSPVGLLDDRAGNALDLFLDNGGRSAKHTVGPITREIERVDGSVYGMAAAARTPGKFAFGVEAGFQGLGTGLARDLGLYQHESVQLLEGTVTAGGRMFEKKVGWGARLGFGKETFEKRLRNETQDGDEFKLSGGDTRDPVSIFELTEGSGRFTRLGLGAGWLASSWGDVTLNWEYTKIMVKGDQNTRRRIYEIEEPRGVDVVSLVTTLRPTSWVTLGGAVGTGGFDVDEKYRFSLSLGQGAPPAISRGTRVSRHMEGEFLRARAALAPPALSELLVGADLNVRYGKETTDPAQGPGSFNDFLDFAARNGFILGPHLFAENDEVRHWDAGLGLGYKVSPRLRLGVEGHRGNDAHDGTIVHARRRVTDFRGGAEYDVNPHWQARVGGWHRALDEDVFTANNEGVANAVTLGAGYRPGGGKYGLDAGVEILDRSTDYPDPLDGTGSGFRFVLYNRWSFN